MRLRDTLATVAFTASLCAVSADAKPLPQGGMTVQDVVDWLHAKGFKGQVNHLPNGAPIVMTVLKGFNVGVVLYDCVRDRCGALEFSGVFEKPSGVSWDANAAVAKMNDWNGNHRWGRAYVTARGNPYVEFDISVSPGGTTEALDDMFVLYGETAVDFAKFVATP